MMKQRPLGYFVTLLGVIWAFSGVARAEKVYYIDVDGVFFEDRGEYGGTFKTGYKLFRIDQRANTLQSVPSGPKEIVVFHQDYEKLKPHLGHGNNRPGNLNMKYTLEDGTEITVGDYQIIAPETFEYFRSTDKASKRRNYWLRDIKAAQEISPNHEYRGPIWPLLRRLLSNEKTAKQVRLISARGHRKKDFKEVFTHLEKEFPYPPDYKKSSFVDLPEFDRYDLNGSVSKKKVEKIADLAASLHRVRLEPGEQMHTIVLADNNQRTIDYAYAKFMEIARSRRTPVRFEIWNMGTEEEVEAARIQRHRPRFAVIEIDGTFREMTAKELAAHGASDCERYFTARLVDKESP